MRKYLDKKAEIETDFQNKADALIDWLRGEYARIAVYRSDVQHEERKKIVEKYEARIGALRTQYIDMEATMFQNAIAGADRSIVVTTPEVSAIRDADRIIGLLESSGIRRNELIINRLRIDMVKRGDMMSVDDVTEILAVDLLGVIPDDEQVVIATNQGEPVTGEDSVAGRSYMNICRRLTGEDIPVEDYMKHEGIFEKISGFFRRGQEGAR